MVAWGGAFCIGDCRDKGLDMGREMKKRTGPRGYDFNADFMREAFALYNQGLGPVAITERMQEQYPSLCRQTVGRIIRKYNWEKHRARYLELKLDGEAERESVVKLLQSTRERLEEVIKGGGKLNHQYFAQLFRCIELQGKLLGWMDGGEEGAVLSTDLEMQAYLEALEEVLGDVLKRNKRTIKRVFEEKLKKAGIENNG